MKVHHHFIIHKPFGYLSQFVNNQNRRRNKKLLGELGNFPVGTMSIGRLDENSEGLLLLTTDGRVSEKIRSNTIEKEYYVQVDGLITDEAINKIKSGVEIALKRRTYLTSPCSSFRLDPPPDFEPLKRVRDERHGPTSWLSVTISEGKFRQVRKMTAMVGFPTLRLVRVRIGNIHLNDMRPGEIIEVDDILKKV
ncbi:MAG: pseudouridine synthase [Bacteroidia bacterium]|nr:pseudouridine synthase [Bacteroidia bacterium]NNJ55457.1 pseudouridine synthase [Bacteroidia bacterium]